MLLQTSDAYHGRSRLGRAGSAVGHGAHTGLAFARLVLLLACALAQTVESKCTLIERHLQQHQGGLKMLGTVLGITHVRPATIHVAFFVGKAF